MLVNPSTTWTCRDSNPRGFGVHSTSFVVLLTGWKLWPLLGNGDSRQPWPMYADLTKNYICNFSVLIWIMHTFYSRYQLGYYNRSDGNHMSINHLSNKDWVVCLHSWVAYILLLWKLPNKCRFHYVSKTTGFLIKLRTLARFSTEFVCMER